MVAGRAPDVLNKAPKLPVRAGGRLVAWIHILIYHVVSILLRAVMHLRPYLCAAGWWQITTVEAESQGVIARL